MSGQAVGWVLRYGPQDRAMRAVLITLADAANWDGEHAHPGVAAMVEGSTYSRPTVFRVIEKLCAEGWAEVEETGRGRGNATVYRLPRFKAWLDGRSAKTSHLDETDSAEKESHEHETVPAAKRSRPAEKRSHPEPKRSHLEGEKVSSEKSTPSLVTTITTSNNEETRVCDSETASTDVAEPLPGLSAGVSVTTPANGTDRVGYVFAYWREVTGHPRARLDKKRRDKIVNALRDYPFDEVLEAMRGWRFDPWPDRPQHNDVVVLLRDAAHIEKFRDLARAGPSRSNGRAGGQMSNFEATKAVMERMRNGEC